MLFFTYIYYPTVLGLPLAPERAVLVPTAHDEPAIRLAIYKPVFCAPRAIAFSTVEERAMVHRLFQNERVPNDIVGVGVDVPADPSAERFRQHYAIEGPYFLYVGRIVESKQCGQLFDAFARWQDSRGTRATLVLMGHREMPVPERADVRLLGRTSDEDKFDALAGCVALVQPSLLESLSMIALEAWACGRPMICDALPGGVGDDLPGRRGPRISQRGRVRGDRRDAHRSSAARVASRSVGPVVRRANVHLAPRGRDVSRSLR